MLRKLIVLFAAVVFTGDEVATVATMASRSQPWPLARPGLGQGKGERRWASPVGWASRMRSRPREGTRRRGAVVRLGRLGQKEKGSRPDEVFVFLFLKY
jgi:hypothetical protein